MKTWNIIPRNKNNYIDKQCMKEGIEERYTYYNMATILLIILGFDENKANQLRVINNILVYTSYFSIEMYISPNDIFHIIIYKKIQS